MVSGFGLRVLGGFRSRYAICDVKRYEIAIGLQHREYEIPRDAERVEMSHRSSSTIPRGFRGS